MSDPVARKLKFAEPDANVAEEERIRQRAQAMEAAGSASPLKQLARQGTIVLPGFDHFNGCDRLCRFNAELLRPFKHIDECREWVSIFFGRPQDVRLAYVSVNLICFWAEVIGGSFNLAASAVFSKDPDHGPWQPEGLFGIPCAPTAIFTILGITVFASYLAAYSLYFMVNVVGSLSSIRCARKSYHFYGFVNVGVTALAAANLVFNWQTSQEGSFFTMSDMYLIAPFVFYLIKTVSCFLCATFCFQLEWQQLNGQAPVEQVRVRKDANGNIISVTQVIGERYNLCDRLCRFNSEFFKPCQHIDECSEWKLIMQNRPRHVRLSFISMNLLGLWASMLGTSVAMLEYVYYDFVLEAMQSFDSIVKWEMYFAVLAASYLIAYILYFLVNVLDSVRWMRVAVVGYMITTSLHLVVAVAFAWAAHTSYNGGFIPMILYVIAAAANAFCASFITKLFTRTATETRMV